MVGKVFKMSFLDKANCIKTSAVLALTKTEETVQKSFPGKPPQYNSDFPGFCTPFPLVITHPLPSK